MCVLSVGEMLMRGRESRHRRDGGVESLLCCVLKGVADILKVSSREETARIRQTEIDRRSHTVHWNILYSHACVAEERGKSRLVLVRRVIISGDR